MKGVWRLGRQSGEVLGLLEAEAGNMGGQAGSALGSQVVGKAWLLQSGTETRDRM
jgi:hypothetical protein